VKIILITGGPCSGRKTAFGQLKERFGKRIYFLPQTSVLPLLQDCGVPESNQVPAEKKGALLREICQTNYYYQTLLRASLATIGERLGTDRMICNQGVLDIAAKWPDGIEDFYSTFDVTRANLLGQYHQILHLESLAVSNPEIYSKLRPKMPVDLATKQDKTIRELYKTHSSWHLIKTDQEPAEVRQQIVRTITQ